MLPATASPSTLRVIRPNDTKSGFVLKRSHFFTERKREPTAVIGSSQSLGASFAKSLSTGGTHHTRLNVSAVPNGAVTVLQQCVDYQTSNPYVLPLTALLDNSGIAQRSAINSIAPITPILTGDVASVVRNARGTLLTAGTADDIKALLNKVLYYDDSVSSYAPLLERLIAMFISFHVGGTAAAVANITAPNNVFPSTEPEIALLAANIEANSDDGCSHIFLTQHTPLPVGVNINNVLYVLGRVHLANLGFGAFHQAFAPAAACAYDLAAWKVVVTSSRPRPGLFQQAGAGGAYAPPAGTEALAVLQTIRYVLTCTGASNEEFGRAVSDAIGACFLWFGPRVMHLPAEHDVRIHTDYNMALGLLLRTTILRLRGLGAALTPERMAVLTNAGAAAAEFAAGTWAPVAGYAAGEVDTTWVNFTNGWEETVAAYAANISSLETTVLCRLAGWLHSDWLAFAAALVPDAAVTTFQRALLTALAANTPPAARAAAVDKAIAGGMITRSNTFAQYNIARRANPACCAGIDRFRKLVTGTLTDNSAGTKQLVAALFSTTPATFYRALCATALVGRAATDIAAQGTKCSTIIQDACECKLGTGTAIDPLYNDGLDPRPENTLSAYRDTFLCALDSVFNCLNLDSHFGASDSGVTRTFSPFFMRPGMCTEGHIGYKDVWAVLHPTLCSAIVGEDGVVPGGISTHFRHLGVMMNQRTLYDFSFEDGLSVPEAMGAMQVNAYLGGYILPVQHHVTGGSKERGILPYNVCLRDSDQLLGDVRLSDAAPGEPGLAQSALYWYATFEPDTLMFCAARAKPDQAVYCLRGPNRAAPCYPTHNMPAQANNLTVALPVPCVNMGHRVDQVKEGGLRPTGRTENWGQDAPPPAADAGCLPGCVITSNTRLKRVFGVLDGDVALYARLMIFGITRTNAVGAVDFFASHGMISPALRRFVVDTRAAPKPAHSNVSGTAQAAGTAEPAPGNDGGSATDTGGPQSHAIAGQSGF
jgi:hypothetical protein